MISNTSIIISTALSPDIEELPILLRTPNSQPRPKSINMPPHHTHSGGPAMQGKGVVRAHEQEAVSPCFAVRPVHTPNLPYPISLCVCMSAPSHRLNHGALHCPPSNPPCEGASVLSTSQVHAAGLVYPYRLSALLLHIRQDAMLMGLQSATTFILAAASGAGTAAKTLKPSLTTGPH